MPEEQIRQLIREEISGLFATERYTFQKHLQLFDGRDIQVGKGVGTKIGIEGGSTGQKLGFFSATPIVEPSSTGEANGFTAGGGTTVDHLSTWTGNVGSTAYRLSDIVKHLKNLGLIAE